MQDVIKIKKNIAVNDEGFIFNPSTGDSYTINPLGNEIVNLLRASKTTTEIINTIVAKYDVDESTIEKDLLDFESQLTEYNIVEKSN